MTMGRVAKGIFRCDLAFGRVANAIFRRNLAFGRLPDAILRCSMHPGRVAAVVWHWSRKGESRLRPHPSRWLTQVTFPMWRVLRRALAEAALGM